MSVDYTIGEDTFEGFVAYPTSAKGPLPGLLISHAWYGLGEGEMMRAEEGMRLGVRMGPALPGQGRGQVARDGALHVRLPVGAPTYTLPDHAPDPR